MNKGICFPIYVLPLYENSFWKAKANEKGDRDMGKGNSKGGVEGMERTPVLVKFPVGLLCGLRERLLEDLSREQFAVLLGKREHCGDTALCCVREMRLFGAADLEGQGAASLHIRKDRVLDVLKEVQRRVDVDMILDVHTHPFSETAAIFSSIDDRDEREFSAYLAEAFPDIGYGSIVLSQKEYDARIWICNRGKICPISAEITCPVAAERVPRTRYGSCSRGGADPFADEEGQFSRGVLALGLEAMRRIADSQSVAVVGVGGLGSIIAENLLHLGFNRLHLVDADRLSVSNMNRIVGASYKDALEERPKAECLKEHLERINPEAEVTAHIRDVTDGSPEMAELLALSDWVVVATDNHSSRFAVQDACLRFFTPFISAGVNISVDPEKGVIEDVSGEVITVRPGDNLCLTCLGRLNPIRIAAESHPDATVREGLVHKGYVTGLEVKEPAVKTLNAIVACIAADVLVNHYTDRQKHEPIWVYEDNAAKAIYPDRDSLAFRTRNCLCHGVQFASDADG